MYRLFCLTRKGLWAASDRTFYLSHPQLTAPILLVSHSALYLPQHPASQHRAPLKFFSERGWTSDTPHGKDAEMKKRIFHAIRDNLPLSESDVVYAEEHITSSIRISSQDPSYKTILSIEDLNEALNIMQSVHPVDYDTDIREEITAHLAPFIKNVGKGFTPITLSSPNILL